MPAALFSVATAIGLVAYAPAAAEWDIELYDDCMARNWGSITYSCELSGGWMDWDPRFRPAERLRPKLRGRRELQTRHREAGFADRDGATAHD